MQINLHIVAAKQDYLKSPFLAKMTFLAQNTAYVSEHLPAIYGSKYNIIIYFIQKIKISYNIQKNKNYLKSMQDEAKQSYVQFSYCNSLNINLSLLITLHHV